jgi:hypothetical protein
MVGRLVATGTEIDVDIAATDILVIEVTGIRCVGVSKSTVHPLAVNGRDD